MTTIAQEDFVQSIADAWRLGAIFGVIFFAVFLVIGVPWMLAIR